MNFKIKSLILISMSLTLFSCSSIRKITYPPGFVYLEKKDIKNTMTMFASNIKLINTIIKSNKHIDRNNNKKIIQALENIETEAQRIESHNNQLTNHMLIGENMGSFKSSVVHAKKMIQKTPPNYYYVGQLSGRCAACHIMQ